MRTVLGLLVLSCLAGCQGTALGIASGAAGVLASGSVLSTGLTVLSDTAQVACASQAAMNSIGAIATSYGLSSVAADLASTSAAAGKVCVW